MCQLVNGLGTRDVQASPDSAHGRGRGAIIAPKVLIISMFYDEADIWYNRMPNNLSAVLIPVPGLHMLYPNVHCTSDRSVCQVTTGEAEINAAATITALVLSLKFDFRSTYFLVCGIAGVNPKYSTLGGVAIARYVVQVALQYEFDAREMPKNFTSPYMAYGTSAPGQYPAWFYGTEVMELNEALRDKVWTYASRAVLSDSDAAISYRARYKHIGKTVFQAAWGPPSVVKCDAATSDVYYTGALLSEAFENVTTLWTNGTGRYCMTAQEDNATLEVLVRMAIEGLVDFSRVIVVRSGADFDRPPPGVSPYEHLTAYNGAGFELSLDNLYNAGIAIVNGIVSDWNTVFAAGIKATNYIGDIFGSLPGQPDFGTGSLTGGKGYGPMASMLFHPRLRGRGMSTIAKKRGRLVMPRGDD
ncbi:purine nucleoside permease-domain-containing protein [Podospora didyma]|uniref:Purine nucleoside permease-domain-containing protein n=1 Tax=Podospora didyma TaxID=330526 RepID=A0AAE0NQ08_9PEZI|nr:purine nucleoside permease-domain-containing protein [Podospora didyma]